MSGHVYVRCGYLFYQTRTISGHVYVRCGYLFYLRFYYFSIGLWLIDLLMKENLRQMMKLTVEIIDKIGSVT
jgi:hypothetical protein